MSTNQGSALLAANILFDWKEGKQAHGDMTCCAMAGDVVDMVLPGLTEHRNPHCRKHYFSILQSVWHHESLRLRLRPPLLALIGDPDPALRDKVLRSAWLFILQCWQASVPTLQLPQAAVSRGLFKKYLMAIGSHTLCAAASHLGLCVVLIFCSRRRDVAVCCRMCETCMRTGDQVLAPGAAHVAARAPACAAGL